MELHKIGRKELKYDSFGKILSDSNPNFDLAFRFAGGLWDEDTKLIRFGVRDYDPEVGRWLSKEPLGFKGSRNWYVYCDDDSVMYLDVNGLRYIDYGGQDGHSGYGPNWSDLGKTMGNDFREFVDEVIKVIVCADWGKFGLGVAKIGSSILAALVTEGMVVEGFFNNVRYGVLGGIDLKDVTFAYDTYMDGLADIFQAFDSNSSVGNGIRNLEVGNIIKNVGNKVEPGAGDILSNAYMLVGIKSGAKDLFKGLTDKSLIGIKGSIDSLGGTILNAIAWWGNINGK